MKASGLRVPVRPHWVRSDRSRLHRSGCEGNEAAQRTRKSQRLGRDIRYDDTMLLQFGERQVVKRSEGGEPREHRESPDYAARAGTLSRLLRLFEANGGHEGMRKYFFVHNGTDYRWEEIAYRAEQAEYQRLTNRFTGVVNPSRFWPWIVWGKVVSVGERHKGDGRMQLDLVPEDPPNPEGYRVSLFYPKEIAGQEPLSALRVGARVVALMRPKIYEATHFLGLVGSLAEPGDLVVLSEAGPPPKREFSAAS